MSIRKVPEYPMLPTAASATLSGIGTQQRFLVSTLTRIFGEYGFAINRLINRTRFGALADRPDAGEADRFFLATDSLQLFYDDGSDWQDLGKAYADSFEQQRAQVWVTFDGTDMSIYDSFNVSSITDMGTGNWDVNFATNLADTNYAPVASSSTGTEFTAPQSRTTSSVSVRNFDNTGTPQDSGVVNLIILGGN